MAFPVILIMKLHERFLQSNRPHQIYLVASLALLYETNYYFRKPQIQDHEEFLLAPLSLFSYLLSSRLFQAEEQALY